MAHTRPEAAKLSGAVLHRLCVTVHTSDSPVLTACVRPALWEILGGATMVGRGSGIQQELNAALQPVMDLQDGDIPSKVIL